MFRVDQAQLLLLFFSLFFSFFTFSSFFPLQMPLLESLIPMASNSGHRPASTRDESHPTGNWTALLSAQTKTPTYCSASWLGILKGRIRVCGAGFPSL